MSDTSVTPELQQPCGLCKSVPTFTEHYARLRAEELAALWYGDGYATPERSTASYRAELVDRIAAELLRASRRASATTPQPDGAPLAAREIVAHISNAALELAFIRHDLTSDEFDAENYPEAESAVKAQETWWEEIKEDALACLTGDETGCNEPEDLNATNCELIWLTETLQRYCQGDTAKAHALVICGEFFRDEIQFGNLTPRLRDKFRELREHVFDVLGDPSVADIDTIKERHGVKK